MPKKITTPKEALKDVSVETRASKRFKKNVLNKIVTFHNGKQFFRVENKHLMENSGIIFNE